MFTNKLSFVVQLTFLVIFISGCKEELMTPLPNSGSGTPQPVTNVEVENLHGESRIIYTVPADPDLLYVKAEWTYKGVDRDARSSYYSNSVNIQGFGDTNTCEVKLYSVNTNEQESEPVTVTIQPLTPPIEDVFKSLSVKPDFGGINVAYYNETRANIVITVLTADSTGELAPADAAYTSLLRDSFSVRGFDPEPREFGLFVKDRWGNLSDTLLVTVTPYFELLLDKTKFKEVNPYPGDVNGNIYSANYPITRAWDDNTSSIYVTKTGLGMPESFTIDLGVTATLSRMKYYQRQSTAFYFAAATPENFDVYGSNDPAADGDWSSWTLLRSCKSVKPSGLPLGTVTDDDISYARAGEDFNFPIGVGAYRYLRFLVHNTYGNSANMTFAELTFWGAY